MTAQNSTGNFSKFGTYYLYKLRTLRPLIILNSIFSLLSYPLLAGFLIPYLHTAKAVSEYRENSQLDYSSLYNSDNAFRKLSDAEELLGGLSVMAMIICCIMLCAIFVMSFVMIRKSFRWLHNKTIVDMDYSLPVSDDTRFCGDLLATMTGCLVPHLLAIGIGRFITLFRPALDDDIEEFIFKSGVIDKLMFTGVFACIMLMAYVLFVVAICGRKAETGLYPIVITVAVPIIHAVCLWISYSNVYGYSFGESMSDFNSLSYTSPFGFLFMSIAYAVSFLGEAEEFALPLFRAAYGIPAILVTLGLFVAAYFLIKYRRAERVGQPFAFSAVKFIIPAIVTFTVVSPFMGVIFMLKKEEESYSYSTNYQGFVIAMIIVTFVMYIIMELISGKGFRRFHVTLLKYAATMGLSVLICFGLHNAQGFGTANYVPNPDKVQSVEFTLRKEGTSYAYFSSTVYEPENIEAITEAHKALPKTADDISYTRRINLEYLMKNGDTVVRSYTLTKSQYNDWMDAVLTSEAYYNELAEDYTRYWLNNHKTVTAVEIDIAGYEQKIPVHFTTEEFLEQLKADCDNADFEQLYGNEMGEAFNIHLIYEEGYYGQYIAVRDWMTNTIAFLEENGVTLVKVEEEVSTLPLNCSTAFLVQGRGDTYFDPVYGFIMNGDKSLGSDMLEMYGFSDVISITETGLEEEELPPYYDTDPDYLDPEYEEYYEAKTEAAAVDAIIVDYDCIKLDAQSKEIAQLSDWIVRNYEYGLPLTYDEEYVYTVVFVTANNANEYLNSDDRQGEYTYYVLPEFYEQADALFKQLSH